MKNCLYTYRPFLCYNNYYEKKVFARLKRNNFIVDSITFGFLHCWKCRQSFSFLIGLKNGFAEWCQSLSSISLFLNSLAFSFATIRSWLMLSSANIRLEIESNGLGLKGFMNAVVNANKRFLTSVLSLFWNALNPDVNVVKVDNLNVHRSKPASRHSK